MTVKLSPVGNFQQYFDNLGNQLAGGQLFTCVAGSTTTLQTTYTTSAGDVPNENPLVLDSSGRLTTALWLTVGDAYQFVLTKPDGTTVLQTLDNISVA